MTTQEQLQQLLVAAPGPFADTVLTHAFRSPPDVPAIHGKARRRVLALVEQARREGTTSLQVITGDPGEGKTHLLAWLRRASEESFSTVHGGPFAVAPIEPIRSPLRVFHHVLRELVRQLGRPFSSAAHLDSATESPLDVLLWRALVRVSVGLVEAPWAPPELARSLRALLPDDPLRFLGTFAEVASGAWPELEQAFVANAMRLPELAGVDRETFRTLAGFPRPDIRSDLMAWLGGAWLPEERATALATAVTLDGEAEAWRGLQTLMQLAGIARLPLVLAFDQVEGIDRLGEHAAAGWLTALGEIYNSGTGTVLLVLCQTQIWPELREQAQVQIRDRLDATPAVSLRALTPEDALALVEARMSQYWRSHGALPPSPTYPFDPDLVLREAREQRLRTPRAVLRHFRELVASGRHAHPAATQPREPAPPTRAAPERAMRKLLALQDDLRRGPPRLPEARADIVQACLREALREVMQADRAVAGVRIEGMDDVVLQSRPAPGVCLTLERGGARRRTYVEVNNSSHGQSVAAAAKRLRDALREGLAQRAMLVRESALPLPPAARDLVEALAPEAAVLWLDADHVAPIAAFEALLNAAAAGDATFSAGDALAIAPRVTELASLIARVLDASFHARARSMRPHLEPNLVAVVVQVLKDERAIFALPRLAARLEADVDRVHSAVEELHAKGLVDVLRDRKRIAVVALRPEV
ncbi:MAG: hypothetical protein MUF54_15770 [Polyangiaceae bacterium]|jgi:hypothetical protein|nr:hypothetical protein [Polyangiaceae bacterium]